MLKMTQEMFGEAADKYRTVLFARRDVLGKTSAKQFIEERQDLQDLVCRLVSRLQQHAEEHCSLFSLLQLVLSLHATCSF